MKPEAEGDSFAAQRETDVCEHSVYSPHTEAPRSA